VLTRLNQIDGVESSSANESGSLVRLCLRPGADSAKVAAQVRRILDEETREHVPVPPGEGTAPLGGQSAVEALQKEQWRDSAQIAQQTAAEKPAPGRRRPLLLLALLLVGAIAGLTLLWWCIHRRAEPSRPHSAKCA
jgi:hypothetical protein